MQAHSRQYLSDAHVRRNMCADAMCVYACKKAAPVHVCIYYRDSMCVYVQRCTMINCLVCLYDANLYVYVYTYIHIRLSLPPSFLSF